MPDLSLGLTVALVGMVGTLLALSLLAGLIALLARVFPAEAQAESREPKIPGAATLPDSTTGLAHPPFDHRP